METVIKVPYTLTEQYKKANLTDRKLVVVFPSDSHIVINNQKDVVHCYGGLNAKPEARIRKFYFPEMFSTLKSFISGDSIVTFDQYRPGVTWDTLNAASVVMKTGNDSVPIHYSIPGKPGMQALAMDSAVVIIIESMAFKRNNFHIDYYWDDKSRTPANLEVDATIMVWDYKENLPVFYGPVTMKTDFQFGLQRKHWDESASDLAKKVIMAAKCL
jgi:hypothetical protein